jgi:hypothetical protein
MPDVLRGNFEPRRQVKVDDAARDLEAEFERAALRRLGGSIAFVSKKHLLWDGKDGKGEAR